MASGDPLHCSKCDAIFSFYSKVEESKSAEGNEEQIWKCEFCNKENIVDLEEEEKPKSSAVNYILEAAAQVEGKKIQGKEDVSVVFCID